MLPQGEGYSLGPGILTSLFTLSPGAASCVPSSVSRLGFFAMI